MCAATAAAVGTAVAAVAAVGTQVAGAVQSSGSSGGSKTPQTKPIPGFAPATGLQGYTARLLASNRATTTPGIQEWAASGGTLRPDWKIPDFTAKEAEQLRFVDKQGRPIPGFDPNTDTKLSPAAIAQRGRERAQSLRAGGYQVPTNNPEINYGRVAAREEMLQNRLAAKGGSAPKLEAKIAKVSARKSRLETRLGG